MEEKYIVEAILFAADGPMTYNRLASLANLTVVSVKDLVLILETEYQESQRGFVVFHLKDKIQIGSNPIYVEFLKRMMHNSKTKGLSTAAMEVLSIIAYKQPITRNEIEYIRGINSDRLVYQLMERRLVEEKGRLEKIGRPKIYGTTDIFLRNFNLDSLKELPQIDYDEIEA